MSKALLTTLMLAIFCSSLSQVSSVIVTTKYGKVEGLFSSHPNASGPFKAINKFLGVPFATPPVGELRFKAPLPLKAWNDIRSAKEHGSVCWQSKGLEFFTRLFVQNFNYSEDCLYLDVYTPNISSSLPVMVYIHGGGYEFGTSLTWPADILALQGVVVVVIQYRLGPFGFLTTGDSAAPGNYGMLDQVEAMRWVKDNIEKFGGNRSKVTIFGASAGGLSVSLHLLSPLSKDLFNQAIAESGVDLSPQAFQSTSFGLHYAKDLAQRLSCPTDDHGNMVPCLREKSPTDILKASEAANFQIMDYTHWGPVVDKNFLHDTPQNLRRKGEFKNAPLMISFNSNEGAGALGIMTNLSYIGLMKTVDNGVSKAFFKTFLAKYAQARHSRKETANVITDALVFTYTPWPDIGDKYALRSQLVDLIGDYYYFAPSHKVADIQSKVAPVYMYEFAHRSIFSFNADWMGVDHGTNAPYDFGYPLVPIWPFKDNEVDNNVSLFIMATYANFARSGNPTPEPVSDVTWERFNSSHRAYLRVDARPKMAASFNPRRMSFWNDYYPKLVELKFDVKKEVVNSSSKVTMAAFFHSFSVAVFAMLSM